MEAKTLPHLFQERVKEYGDRIALRKKDFGIWNEISWKEYDHMVRCAACGLISLGVRKGDAVSIISRNRLEWVYSDLAVMSIGARTVGIYPTNVAGQVEYIVKHSESKVYIAEDEEQLDKILETRNNCPDLGWTIVIDPKGLRNFKDPMYLTWDELIRRGEEFNRKEPGLFLSCLSEIKEDDICLLMYTSGTTGPPKGVMMTHRNTMAAAKAWAEANPHYDSDTILSFLPLSHIAQRLFTSFVQIYVGYTVHFGEDDLNTLNQDILEVRPHLHFAVPRIWEKMYSGIIISLKDSTWVEKKFYKMAMKLAFRYTALKLDGNSISPLILILYRLFDWFVYRKIRETLGMDRCRIAYSGAAPISPELMRYFFAIGINILEAYGMTEAIGANFVNKLGKEKIGTVGLPLPCIEAKVGADGELLMKGNIMKGYFKNPEATAEAIDADGYLHTGDIAEMDEERYTRLVDRKKDIIITAGGENIAPQNIENELKFSPYIHDAVVVGDKRKFVAALIIIDEENVTKFAQEMKIPYTTYADLSQNKEIYDLIFKEVQKVNDNLARASTIKKFAIIDQELDTDRDELTPTMKVKRSTISKKYEKLIDSFYR
ncbi:MAG: hypothetical protein B1H11_09805 [Desulfobacteraceae bacterium 4484_190.1]|nr:MAG: hypothetical protein B1H11_09805 [Desulfobacteraceae bacterium 4484_190.1]